VESTVTSQPASAGSETAGFRGAGPGAAARPGGRWWLLAVLAVAASLIVGGTVQHAFDQRRAARALYRMQVLTTEYRFLDAEHSQVALPVGQRSALAFGHLAAQIGKDGGVNGYGTLNVSLGAGSAAQPTQLDFAVTVASPYASTTVAVWSILVTGHGAVSSDAGACVLWSTLLGPGRATTDLQLGGGYFVPPCSPRWWSPGPIMEPHLGAAGIPQSPG
jgi:hypothetical protein